MLIDSPQIVEGSAIQNLTLPSGATFPDLPSLGELFFRTDQSALYYYTGTEWADIRALDADLGALSALTTSGIIVRASSGSAVTRAVAAGTGISVANGDGVAGNPTVTLTNTTVAPAAYGSAAAIPTFTVNAQGRLTAAGTVPLAPSWTSVTGRPTTIGGYGITDDLKLGTFPGTNLGTSAVGAATAAARADHVHNMPNIDDLRNVGISGKAVGDSLVWNGTSWINRARENSSTAQADRLTVSRRIMLDDDATGQAFFDGSQDVTIDVTLASTGVAPGTFGSGTSVPTITVDAKGRVTSAGTAPVTPAWASVTGKPTTIGGYGITDDLKLSTSAALPLATSASAGTAATASRTDHVHQLPTIDSVVGVSVATKTAGDVLSYNGTSWVDVAQSTLVAGNATKLASARSIALSSDATGQGSFDGSANITIPLTLANTGVVAGSFGSATQAPTFTVDSKGRLTAAGAVTVTPAWASITNKPTTIAGYGITDVVGSSSVGAANGLATLDSSGKLTTEQIPSSLVGALQYQGTWNAATNNPPIASGEGTKGQFYKVSAAGTTSIDGNAYWQVGDMVIYNGATWDRLEGGATEVTSVAGKVGAVTLVAADVGGLAGSATTDTRNASNISSGTLSAARLPARTGDVTSPAGSAVLTLSSTGVTVGSYGSESAIPAFMVDAKGRLTAVASIPLTFAGLGGKPTTVAGYGITDDLKLGSTAGTALGTASAGTAATAARSDHVHPMPDVEGLRNVTVGTKAAGDNLQWNGTQWVNVPASTAASATAQKLATARTISITGAGTGSTAFDGSANAAISLTLADSGVAAGSYGSATVVPRITVDRYGRLTSAGTNTITPAGIGAVPASSLGAANGTATLDADGKLTTEQIPPALVGALQYQGTWDAATNAPALSAATAAKGQFYKVSVAGTNTITGTSTAWQVGDLVIFNGSSWDRVEGGATEVSSVAGRVGNVVLTSADIGGLAGSATTDTRNAANISSGTLSAARLPAFTGDATSAAGTSALTLANTAVVTGSYGSATTIPTFTVDSKGRLTAAGATALTWANIAGKPTTIAGYGITDDLKLSTTVPAAIKTAAAVGTATTAARADHVHTIALLDDVQNVSTSTKTAGDVLSFNGTNWVDIPQANLTAGNATKLATSRNIGVSGDATGTVAFNGTANVAIPLTLANSGVTAGSYGSGTSVPAITVDAKGRITTAGTVTVTPAWANVTGKPTTAAGFGFTDLGAANGVATLDGAGKLTAAQIPTSLVGALQYQGTWDASTNSPALANGVGTKGQFYKVSVAGTTSLDGNAYWQVGDMAIYNGTAWDRLEGGATEVTSVAGRVGAIVLAAADVGGLAGSATVDTRNAANISSGILPAARLPVFTGDVTSPAGSAAMTLANSGVTAGSYGGAASIPSFTVDAKGRLTAAGATALTFASLSGKPTTLSGYGITDAQPLDSDLTALANLTTVGLYVNTGVGTATSRLIAGGTGISVANGNGVSGNPTVALANTAVTAGTYGDAAEIPTFTVDAQGRLTSASSVGISKAGVTTALGFTPVQQGGGLGGQSGNTVKIGWTTDATGLKATVDTTDLGYIYTSASGKRVPFSEVVSKPTTVAGYGITDGATLTGGRLTPAQIPLVLADTLDFKHGADIASAATVNLQDATGNYVNVTGTTTVSAITLNDGAMRIVRFTGALTLVNSANLVLPGSANIVTAPGEVAIFVGDPSTVVRCVSYSRGIGGSGGGATGLAFEPTRTVAATTAATAIDIQGSDDASFFRMTLGANTAVTFSNLPVSTAKAYTWTLVVVNDAVANRALSFGNTIKWAGAQVPNRTTAANGVDVYTFVLENGVIYGSLAILDAR